MLDMLLKTPFLKGFDMAGYTKLFSEIIASSIWQADNKTRILWITLLALSDRHGKVITSLPSLAHLANIGLAECKKAVKKLESPDPYNHLRDFEGRRIKGIEDGYQILDYDKYRNKMLIEERREYLRKKQAEHREKVKKQRG